MPVFALAAPGSAVLFFVLLFTRYWLISVLYACWWFVDWETPARGGRRIDLICRLPLWRHMRDYFPIQVSDATASAQRREQQQKCHHASLHRAILDTYGLWGFMHVLMFRCSFYATYVSIYSNTVGYFAIDIRDKLVCLLGTFNIYVITQCLPHNPPPNIQPTKYIHFAYPPAEKNSADWHNWLPAWPA